MGGEKSQEKTLGMFNSCLGIHGNNSFPVPWGGCSFLKGFSARFSSRSGFFLRTGEEKNQEKKSQRSRIPRKCLSRHKDPAPGFVFLCFWGILGVFPGSWGCLAPWDGMQVIPGLWIPRQEQLRGGKITWKSRFSLVLSRIFPWIGWMCSSQEEKQPGKAFFPRF